MENEYRWSLRLKERIKFVANVELEDFYNTYCSVETSLFPFLKLNTTSQLGDLLYSLRKCWSLACKGDS